ncbi:MAG: hypothetical protein J6V32_04010 [Elusimicrobiaceae bacterium]|nr:hypothetical protein [Elusimicrobiaceae bacterium]
MKKIMRMVFAGFLLAGCATLEQANVDWIAIGPTFAPTKVKDLEIINGRDDVKRPYGNLGLLRIKNLRPDRDTLLMAVEKGKKIAASKGANAIQIGQYNSASDGLVSDPRVTLFIYAIKYVDNLTEEDKKAIEEFKLLGNLQ